MPLLNGSLVSVNMPNGISNTVWYVAIGVLGIVLMVVGLFSAVLLFSPEFRKSHFDREYQLRIGERSKAIERREAETAAEYAKATVARRAAEGSIAAMESRVKGMEEKATVAENSSARERRRADDAERKAAASESARRVAEQATAKEKDARTQAEARVKQAEAERDTAVAEANDERSERVIRDARIAELEGELKRAQESTSYQVEQDTPQTGAPHSWEAPVTTVVTCKLLVEMSRHQEAIDVCTAEIEKAPYDAQSFYYRGRAYAQLPNGADDAIRDYTEAIRLNPSYSSAYNARGAVYRTKKNDLQLALDDYTSAIELNESFGLAYRNRAYVYFLLGENENAIADYQKALELRPGDTIAIEYLQKLGVDPF